MYTNYIEIEEYNTENSKCDLVQYWQYDYDPDPFFSPCVNHLNEGILLLAVF